MSKHSTTETTKSKTNNISERSQDSIPTDLTHKLRFEQFRQVATLSVVAAGGVLILLQAGYIELSFKSGTVVVAFALAAAFSLFGQDKLIGGLEAGRGRTRAARLFLLFSYTLLGVGGGLLAGVVL